MWQRLKLVALLCCLVAPATILARLVVPQRTAPTGPTPSDELRAIRARSDQRDWRLPVMFTLAAAGALFMLADAFRREYEGPKALPVAIAIVGVLMWGFLSLVYYAVWGWMPPRAQRVRSTAFCACCIEETTERAAPGTTMFNALIGTRLIGSADACDACSSTVKTLWLVLLLPVVPFGSYRVLPIGKPTFNQAWYISRKLPAMRWSQVLPLLLLAAAAAGLIAYLARTE